MERQEFGLAVFEPLPRRGGLALRTMPVAARVVSDDRMAARRVLAARDVAAERGCAAALDRAHHLQLIEAHMAAVGLAPSRTVVAEDVRDLQSRSSHNRRLLRRRPLGVSPGRLAARRAQARERALDLGDESVATRV